MTRSRLLWFVAVTTLTTPLLLATYRDGGDLTAQVWVSALGTAAVIALVIALLWGRPRQRGERDQ